MVRLIVLLLTFAIFINCNDQIKDHIYASSKLEYTFIKESNVTNPIIRGIWKSIGNGYYLEIRSDSILLYSYTKSYCYKEKNDYLEGLLNAQSQFEKRSDTIGIYFTDYGVRTEYLQTKKDFVKIKELPSNCLTFSEMTKLDHKNLLALYQETLKENYAFAEERRLNWKDIFESHQDSLSRHDESLFQVMGRIATSTKDQHTKVISKDGTTLQYRVTPSALDIQFAFEKQDQIDNLNTYFDLFFKNSKQHIADSLLVGKGKLVANGNIEWGILNGTIGYLNIASFAGFLNSNYSRAQQIDSLKSCMEEIIEAVQDTEALIIDISFNFGGYDASAITIASYFTNVPIYPFTSQVYVNGTFYTEDTVVILPAGKSFQKPVYLLMTDISRSAAESFAMMMDALPNVTLLGTPTLGTLSGMLGKSIGEFYTTYSNQRLMNATGEHFEVVGVTPDIDIQVFPRADVMNGHLTAVRKIVDLIEGQDHTH